MRIKTFQGRTLEDVLPQIREELGAGAVVLGQRSKVQGGVGGFFGTKVIEVTAADRMPDDEQLVELEDQMMSGAPLGSGAGDGEPVEEAAELAERFAGAMRMGRRGGLDITDDWDPSQDEELAHEYGRVLQHAAAAGFSELDVPAVAATVAAPPETPVTPAAPTMPPATSAAPIDHLEQARALAERAHSSVQAATTRVEGTYAPPAAMPRTSSPTMQTFAASVQDVAPPATELSAVTLPADVRAAGEVDPLSAAVELIDLRAVAALRGAVEASRRIATARTTHPELEAVVARLTDIGVDDDVVDTIVQSAVRHRAPFAPQAPLTELARDVLSEHFPTRSGTDAAGGRVLAVVGPSNGGKTSIVAKLARAYAASGCSVGVIAIVPDDPTAPIHQDQRLVALGVEVRYVAAADQARIAVDAMARHDLILVDTPGGSYQDSATFDHLQRCLGMINPNDVHVVVPLSTSSREASSLVDAFRTVGANRLIVSKLDESRHIGQLANFGFRLGMPMTFLSDGPRIPEDLRAASSREIVDRILPMPQTPSPHRDQEMSAP